MKGQREKQSRVKRLSEWEEQGLRERGMEKLLKGVGLVGLGKLSEKVNR